MTKAKADPAGGGKPPNSDELAALLAGSHAAFLALTQRGSGFRCEWKRYSKKSPWVLKVCQGDRTLLYASPMAGGFEVTVVIGERAAQAALAGRVSKAIHASIRAAKPYVEGRPVRVMVREQADLAGVEQLVAVKLDPTGDPREVAVAASEDPVESKIGSGMRPNRGRRRALPRSR